MGDEIEVKCSGCSKKLSISKMHFLPGKVVYDRIMDMTYGTGKNYCDECFANIIGASFEVGPKRHKIEDKVIGYEHRPKGLMIRYKPKEPKVVEKEEIKVFKGQMPTYEVKTDGFSGFIERVIHGKAKNGALYKAVRFRGDKRYFYIWDKNLYENIKAGDTVEIEFVKTKFPRIVMIKKGVKKISEPVDKEKVEDKEFECEICGRPIRHRGNCLACNIYLKSLKNPF